MNNREELAILVVDDMKFNCEFIRRALSSEGYSDIRIAGSASEALELLHQRHVDVLLADWVMPEMDGLELTDRVRQIDEETHRYTCVLLLTARDDTNSILQAFERGVDDYITKPPNKQELAARIYAAGRVSSLHNQLLEAMSAMREQFAQHATVDQLTGLGNQRDAERRLEELLKLVDSRGGGVCCTVMQLADVAPLQGRYGQRGYDEIQVKLARRLQRLVRPNDILARLSESELLVAIHYAEVDTIQVKHFRRILQGMTARPLKSNMGFIDIDYTMGVSCQRNGDPLIAAGELIQQARNKLAQGKAGELVA